MPDVSTFQECIEATSDRDRALLIGNGFSAEYFSYSNLLAAAGLDDESPVRALFNQLETVDFEAVISALEDAIKVETAYGNVGHAKELGEDAKTVRESLVRAVNATHPGHRDDLDIHYEGAAEFISQFGSVFTLNYDLLLYWVNLERSILRDGFGKGKSSGGFRGPFVESAYCEIFNIHGGLHLFQDEIGEVYKALNTGDGVIANITGEIADKERLPLYVAEGNSTSKLRKINSVEYLRHCYRKLEETEAVVFVYGHSADPNDEHIYRAIFGSKAETVLFGVYKPTEEALRNFDAQLARYQKLGGKKIDYGFFDSETANVWKGLPEAGS